MLCHSQAIPFISSYSAKPLCQSCRKTPDRSHSRNRAWIALALPKTSFGKAFHWQPVRNTYMMPSNTVRAAFGLRPPPALRLYSFVGSRFLTGISGSTRSQNLSDTTHDSSRFLIAATSVARRLSYRQNNEIIYG
jgi:hypothetical protein